MHDAIRANPAIENIALRYRAIGQEYFSLEHTIANYLRYSGFNIQNHEINPLISIYVPQQNDPSQIKTMPLNSDGDLAPKEKKSISMLEARIFTLDLLSKQLSPKTSRQIKEEMNLKGLEINKHSLKAVLTKMKKEGLIQNDIEKGGWIIVS